MRIAFIVLSLALMVLVLALMGCAHTRYMDPPQTAEAPPVPCGPDSCGKAIVWETL